MPPFTARRNIYELETEKDTMPITQNKRKKDSTNLQDTPTPRASKLPRVQRSRERGEDSEEEYRNASSQSSSEHLCNDSGEEYGSHPKTRLKGQSGKKRGKQVKSGKTIDLEGLST